MATLITGLGYLGVPLAAELLRRGEQVVGLESFFSTQPAAVAPLKAFPTFRLVRGSLTSPASLQRAMAAADITCVYHLAAQASAHPLAASASYTERTNLVGPRLLLEALPARRPLTIVLASSFRVYGDDLGGEVAESHPYGTMADLAHLSKIHTEKLLEMYARHNGLSAVAVRLGVVYGLGPCMKDDPRFLTVPNLFCLKAARGERLEVHPGAERPIGFIHLSDAVAALLAGAALARPGFKAVNAVSEVLSVPEVASVVQERARARGLEVEVKTAGRLEPSERWRAQSSLDQAGYRAEGRMAISLDEVLEYFVDRGPWTVDGGSAATGRRSRVYGWRSTVHGPRSE